MNNFIVSFYVPPMIHGIGWGMYLFFAGWLALGALFVWFCVPETKNKTQEEIDVVFGSIAAQHEKDVLAAVREEVGPEASIRLRIHPVVCTQIRLPSPTPQGSILPGPKNSS